MTTFAFIGFGEAGGLLVKGLKDSGADVAAAYDILIESNEKASAIRDKAAALGIVALGVAEQRHQRLAQRACRAKLRCQRSCLIAGRADEFASGHGLLLLRPRQSATIMPKRRDN